MQHVFEDRHEHAERVLGENRALGDLRDVFVLRHGNREAVAQVHVQHHVHVGAAVANVDDAVGRQTETGLQIHEHGDFAVAGRNPLD